MYPDAQSAGPAQFVRHSPLELLHTYGEHSTVAPAAHVPAPLQRLGWMDVVGPEHAAAAQMVPAW